MKRKLLFTTNALLSAVLLLAALPIQSQSGKSQPCTTPVAQTSPTQQPETDLPALNGLAPVVSLSFTSAGQAALAANYTVTGGIQTGTIQLPTLLPFPDQQQQALRDVAITGENLAQLSDGLGTTLGSAYLARAHYIDRDNWTCISATIQNLIEYATSVSGGDSNSAKYFFANETLNGPPDGAPIGSGKVSTQADDILQQIATKINQAHPPKQYAKPLEPSDLTDPFGRAYNLRAGSPGADKYGDSRPFQTEPSLTRITGPDYFNTPTDNIVYNRGILMDLTNSPSYPSGHTTYGYTGALLLALLVPDRYPQMITRGAEYGNDRIIVGAHYAMDVLGGRTIALYDMAHLLADDKQYEGRTIPKIATIRDFRETIQADRDELAKTLEPACAAPINKCAQQDTGRFSNPAANEAFYSSTQTYNLPVVHPETAGIIEDVNKLAPEAGWLLKAAFPSLSLEQANKILTDTEGPGGGFLNDGSSFGIYSRLNLYAASLKAIQLAAIQPAHAK